MIPKDIIALWKQGFSKKFIVNEEYKDLKKKNLKEAIKIKASRLKEIALMNVEDILLKWYKGL